jgi:hypothetical protein
LAIESSDFGMTFKQLERLFGKTQLLLKSYYI